MDDDNRCQYCGKVIGTGHPESCPMYEKPTPDRLREALRGLERALRATPYGRRL